MPRHASKPADTAEHRSPDRGAAANRDKILRAAESLFAAEGIDGVSLRVINRAAGQGNTSAVQYHFADRQGLVQAVLARHQATTDPHRHQLLDDWEATGAGDLRGLADALVLPLVHKLDDPDGGRDYLRVASEFYSRARARSDLGPSQPGTSMARWHLLVRTGWPHQDDGALPSRYPAVRLALSEVARRAVDGSRRSHRLFTNHLVDLVSAVLGAPSSVETERLLDERERQPGRRPDPPPPTGG